MNTWEFWYFNSSRKRVTVNSNTEYNGTLSVKVSSKTSTHESLFVAGFGFTWRILWWLYRVALSASLFSTSLFLSLKSHQPFPVLFTLPLLPCFAASTPPPLSSPAGDLSDQAPSAEIEVTLEFTACSHLLPQALPLAWFTPRIRPFLLSPVMSSCRRMATRLTWPVLRKPPFWCPLRMQRCSVATGGTP